MVKNIYIYIYFMQLYLSNLLGKNILPNLTNSQEPEPVNESMQEPEPIEIACEKNQEAEPLGKKRAEAAK